MRFVESECGMCVCVCECICAVLCGKFVGMFQLLVWTTISNSRKIENMLHNMSFYRFGPEKRSARAIVLLHEMRIVAAFHMKNK